MLTVFGFVSLVWMIYFCRRKKWKFHWSLIIKSRKENLEYAMIMSKNKGRHRLLDKKWLKASVWWQNAKNWLFRINPRYSSLDHIKLQNRIPILTLCWKNIGAKSYNLVNDTEVSLLCYIFWLRHTNNIMTIR